ncbi:MAG: uncharacterized protein KVP18_002475 [Porospora cf. gigantea A]|uniref:uncharacterized protein n=2 Tax=Porospora cf. gigantea A TaxID=2853593 RepID=UPI00355A914B|nr:MAG: hypothetical protein KVP18_002475 [Porospora cf. gigantea A]
MLTRCQRALGFAGGADTVSATATASQVRCADKWVSANIMANLMSVPALETLKALLENVGNPIEDRMRGLFWVRHHGTAAALPVLLTALADKESVLLRHEVAYVLGQMGDLDSIPHLTTLLCDLHEDAMTRHEAAEALGAIGDASALPVLRQFEFDENTAVAETCHLAIRLIEKKNSSGVPVDEERVLFYLYSLKQGEGREFVTRDPCVSIKGMEAPENVPVLGKMLLDSELDLTFRYEALFTLRNIGTDAAAEAIIHALQTDTSSALFRHEIAFVLGQIQTHRATSALCDCLAAEDEHKMARHEAALALGSVGAVPLSSSAEVEKCRLLAFKSLQEFKTHPNAVVAQSCLVALDNIGKEFGEVQV